MECLKSKGMNERSRNATSNWLEARIVIMKMLPFMTEIENESYAEHRIDNEDHYHFIINIISEMMFCVFESSFGICDLRRIEEGRGSLGKRSIRRQTAVAH